MAESRRDYLLISAINPVDGKSFEVQISYQRIQAMGKRSRGATLEAAYLVPEILQHPTAIFEGLRREEDEDKHGYGWLCYCGIPSCSFRNDGIKAKPHPHEVYLVFVNHDRVVYNWRWEPADPENLSLPVDHQSRFTRSKLI